MTTSEHLTQPLTGRRRRLTPDGNVGYSIQNLPLTDPLDGATDAERDFYLTHYADASLAELLRRLRHAEWNADLYRAKAEGLEREAAKYPPLYQIQELDAQLCRVRALLEAPRRTIPKAELAQALAVTPVE